MDGNTHQIHAFCPSKILQSRSLQYQSNYTLTADPISSLSNIWLTSLRCFYSNQSKICSPPRSNPHICCHPRTTRVHTLTACRFASTPYNNTNPFLRSYASSILLPLSLILQYSPNKPHHWVISSTRFDLPPLRAQISPNSTFHPRRCRCLGRAASPRSIIPDSRPSYGG